MAVLADVRVKAELEAAADRVKAELGPVDILVNNAGTRQDGPFILMGDEKWEEVMNVNLRGTVYATKAFVRGMMARKWGRIVNIVSPTGIIGKAGQTNYGASKGAVIALTRSLAREMAPFGVLVNAVNPGLIHTELTARTSPRRQARPDARAHHPQARGRARGGGRRGGLPLLRLGQLHERPDRQCGWGTLSCRKRQTHAEAAEKRRRVAEEGTLI